MTRCAWAESTPLLRRYHDHEWGVPLHHDPALFEMLTLEGAQAGLSWLTILKRRPDYRRAFADFDPEVVARFTGARTNRLLADAGIIRNRLKIEGTVKNARAFLALREEFGSFDSYVWGFVGGKPILNAWKTPRQVPATSPESDALSRELKKRGFTFVGPTICYAFMQAIGMVNDHVTGCFRYRACAGMRRHA